MNRLGHVEAEAQGADCILRLHGEVDMSTAAELFADMERAVPNEATHVLVDLSATAYLDSVGVRFLFAFANRLLTRRRNVRIVAPRDSTVRAVLDLVGFGTVAPIDEDLGAQRPP